MPYQISVLDKNGIETNVNFSFKGWLGTIHERPSFKNFVKTSYESEGKTKFEVSITDNRITVFQEVKSESSIFCLKCKLTESPMLI